MKRIILVVFQMLLFAAIGFSQTPIKNRIEAKITELKGLSVDTIVTYHPYCVGCYFTFNKNSTCHSTDEEYVVWIKDGKNFIQKFNQCYTFYPMSDSVKLFTETAKKHLNEIRKEEIKPVTFKKIINGKEETYVSDVDHTFHYDFEFYIKEDYFEKNMDDYNLSVQYEGSDFNKPQTKESAININYAYNQGTYLNKIKEIIEKNVKALKFEKQ